MDRLINAMKMHAGGLDMSAGQTRIGIVTSYDPVNVAARVLIQPEGVLSGWLPVGSVAVGAVSIVVPPSIGDQVLLEPQEGDSENYVITKRLFSAGSLPPNSPSTSAPVQSGEMAIFGASGACLHLHADGTWWLAGDLHVNGDVYDRHGSLDRLRGNYDAHKHGGGSTTDHPDPE